MSIKNVNFVNVDYCRPIKIEENKNFLLYDEDFLNLFDMTISQYFLLVLENSCPICNKFQEGNNLITLNCNCKLCESCLKSRINKFTDNKIILNDFEKSKYYSFRKYES